VNAWPGAVLVLVCMLLGWAAKQTGLGTFVGMVALVPVLGVLSGGSGAIAGVAVVVPMFVKRIVGNSRPIESRGPTYMTRLVFDRDALQQT
jgi:hypothetical protein